MIDERMEGELDALLAMWATAQRMDNRQVAQIRAAVLTSEQVEPMHDPEWLWSLLRPVTALLDRNEDSGAYVPYLQLA